MPPDLTLAAPFAVVHKKDIKNKRGEVVAQVDYVGWADVADRLDAAAPGWSFQVVHLGDDWCHGRLTFGERTFENVGYAENADSDWKKEVLKDAVSDALKRCAALAGVARYLYQDAKPHKGNGAATPKPRPEPVVHSPATPSAVATGSMPPEPTDEDWAGLVGATQKAGKPDVCPVHGQPWKTVPAGTSKAGKQYASFRACPEFDCKERPR